MKNIIYILLLTVALTSCDDFLDVKPVGKLIPSKIQEFDKLLNNSNLYQWDYLDNNTGCNLAMLGDNYEYSENIFASELKISNPNVDRLMAYKFNRPYNDPKNRIIFGIGVFIELPIITIMSLTVLRIY